MINPLKKINRNLILEYLGITLGVLVMSLGLSIFLIPGQIVAGGVSGIAIILYHKFNFPVGLVMLIINIPIFITALKTFGINMIFRTLYGIVALSFFIEVLQQYEIVLTEDLLLAAIYGGILIGIGLGLVFRYNGTTGGTDMSARIVSYYFDHSTGQALLFLDGLVILMAAGVFGLELALYAVITIFIVSKAVDIIQEGPYISKMAFIISDENDEIEEKIIKELDRGLTSLKGSGGFTGQTRPVLMCVVNRSEVASLKRMVYSVDEDAFLIISSVNEVLGEGFKNEAGRILHK